MTRITYIEASGQSTTIDLPEGSNLMHGATANGIELVTVLRERQWRRSRFDQCGLLG